MRAYLYIFLPFSMTFGTIVIYWLADAFADSVYGLYIGDERELLKQGGSYWEPLIMDAKASLMFLSRR